MIDGIKIIGALIATALGIAICILQAIQAHWLSALSALILGPSVGFMFLVGPFTLKEFPLACTATVLAGALGFFAILNEHPAFDAGLSSAHSEALSSFISMPILCAPMSSHLRAVHEAGIMACARQNNSSLLDAAMELQIAKLLDPASSLLDQAYSAIKPPRTDWCAAAFTEADRLCPVGFYAMDEKLKNLLRQ